MKQATYTGPHLDLQGQKALIRDSLSPVMVLAQFNKMGLTHKGNDLSHHWHPFPKTAFTTNATLYHG